MGIVLSPHNSLTLDFHANHIPLFRFNQKHIPSNGQDPHAGADPLTSRPAPAGRRVLRGPRLRGPPLLVPRCSGRGPQGGLRKFRRWGDFAGTMRAPSACACPLTRGACCRTDCHEPARRRMPSPSPFPISRREAGLGGGSLYQRWARSHWRVRSVSSSDEILGLAEPSSQAPDLKPPPPPSTWWQPAPGGGGGGLYPGASMPRYCGITCSPPPLHFNFPGWSARIGGGVSCLLGKGKKTMIVPCLPGIVSGPYGAVSSSGLCQAL